MKKLRVTVEGKVYEVLVEILEEGHHGAAPSMSSLNAPISSAAVTAPAATAKPKASGPAGSGDVTSPLAGKLVSIDVKVGQDVTEGQQVATIEAMKMNTYIYAPKAGKVASIAVAAGEAVDEGKVLLSIA